MNELEQLHWLLHGLLRVRCSLLDEVKDLEQSVVETLTKIESIEGQADEPAK